MALRFYLQPIMSVFLAIRDGLKDAQTGAPPFFWALFTDPEHRAALLAAAGGRWARSSSWPSRST
jgi:hypothetical protein